ncbi:MAG: hypothetical protein ABI758_00470 [Candidatus Woesebacteria bacterium]
MTKFPPNPYLNIFEPFIGIWTTTGSHSQFPDTILHGKASFQWHESSAFIIMRASVDHPKFPDGMAIIGADGKLGTYSMLYYDERGVSRICQVSMKGNTFKWWRDEPGFSQRYSFTISKDKQSIVGKGELCTDGTTWEKDLDLNYTRVEERTI